MNTETFIEKASKLHKEKYKYTKVKYINNHTKIIIECKKHGDFTQTPTNHLSGKGCRKCSIEYLSNNRKLSTNTFIERANKKHNYKYDYSKTIYVTNREKITISCPNHGDFIQVAQYHLSGNGCPKCGLEHLTLSQRSDTGSFIKKAIKIHKNRYDYSKVNYVKSNLKVEILCKKHGTFYQRPNAHLLGQGCKKCSVNEISKVLTLSQNTFIEKAKQKHNNYYFYDRVVYKKSWIKVIITCPVHGDFTVTPNNHLSKMSGCPKCKDSIGEETISRILTKHGFNYIREYKIPNQVYKFRYDFYLPEYNVLIEYHGIQHYKPIEFFGGEESLRDNIRRDTFKRNIAYELKIPMLVFNYKQFKHFPKEKFEKFILSKINKLCFLFT